MPTARAYRAPKATTINGHTRSSLRRKLRRELDQMWEAYPFLSDQERDLVEVRMAVVESRIQGISRRRFRKGERCW